ncbi:hypothetical protein [Kitasatospora sp. NPDC058046]|uniref:hypothetical protein n=1 Tax=Kitasatospora sp. NPDC058046 TaxID=3346312 RepID=UPI0036D89CAE
MSKTTHKDIVPATDEAAKVADIEARTRPLDTDETRPAACKHGHVPLTDTVGDPIAQCANADGRTEWGAFNTEGCFYVYDCAVDVSNASVVENLAAQSPPDDPESTWSRICPDHEGQPADACSECDADYQDHEQ